MPSRFTTKIYGLGPLYVALETRCHEPARFSRAWIKEVNEPYREGHGWRVRLGHFAAQFGRCTKHPEADVSDDAHMNYLGMRLLPYLPPGGTDDPSDQERDQGSGEHEVRAGEPVDVQRDGVVEGGDLPGVQPVRVGPGQDRQEDGPQASDPSGQAAAQDRQGG